MNGEDLADFNWNTVPEGPSFIDNPEGEADYSGLNIDQASGPDSLEPASDESGLILKSVPFIEQALSGGVGSFGNPLILTDIPKANATKAQRSVTKPIAKTDITWLLALPALWLLWRMK